MEKAQVLVIRKADKTIHQAPLENEARLIAYNKKLAKDKQFTIERMDQDKADALPFVDESYVTAGEALSKLSDKDAKIKELEERLAALEKGPEADDTAKAVTVNTPADDVKKVDYNSLTVDALKAALEGRQISYEAKALKADLVSLLEADDTAKAVTV